MKKPREQVHAHGSWRENSELITKQERRRGTPNTEWLGVCQGCDQVLPAAQLTLKRLGFNRGEKWLCTANCLHPRKERLDD